MEHTALYPDLINKYSEEFSLEKSLIAAICMQESSFETWRCRYEPNWQYFTFALHYAQLLGISFDTELQFQKTSWGLMQVMGGVARELGYDDYINKLVNPDFGLKYGCKKLASLKKKYEELNDAISSYNQGIPSKDSTGRYHNQTYVDSVLVYKAQYAYLD